MEFTCRICPKACRIIVSEDGEITNAKCEKGELNAKNELLPSRKVLTTTVKTAFGKIPVLPVKTDRPIEISKIKDVMKIINKIVVNRPLSLGEVVYKNILEDINLICTVNMNRLLK